VDAGQDDSASPGHEPEEQILRRLERRIRSALSNPSKKHLEGPYLVSAPENFWDRHLDSLVNDTLALGLARSEGLRPFSQLLHDALTVTRYLAEGYIQLAGHLNNKVLADWMPSSVRTAPKVRALAELHARALVSTEEIFVLSTMGYPSGALSVARTLHEIRVTAKFLYRYEAKLSERYLASHVVDMWKSLEDLRPPGAARRRKAWLEVERQLAAQFDDVISRFGDSMLIENGWALPRFVKRGSREGRLPRRIPFSRIEEQVRQPWDRARYRAASRHVHATRMGTISVLQAGEPGVALLGPRPFALDRPAVQAMWDMQEVSDSLLRSCARFNGSREIYYWLEALDQIAYVVRGSISQGQQLLDSVFTDRSGSETTDGLS